MSASRGTQRQIPPAIRQRLPLLLPKARPLWNALKAGGRPPGSASFHAGIVRASRMGYESGQLRLFLARRSDEVQKKPVCPQPAPALCLNPRHAGRPRRLGHRLGHRQGPDPQDQRPAAGCIRPKAPLRPQGPAMAFDAAAFISSLMHFARTSSAPRKMPGKGEDVVDLVGEIGVRSHPRRRPPPSRSRA